jgi:large subunit ribosomal protein L29
MKAKEVQKFSDEELGLEVESMRRKMFDLRCQAVTEKIQDTSQFGKIKKDMARLQTELRARQLAQQSS